MKAKYIIALTITILFIFAGCGGGSGSGGSSSSAATTQTGTFIDAPVKGLRYETATFSGFTDYQGSFQYKSGEKVKFFLANLELGTVTGAKWITPLTLNGESDLNNISNKAIGLARILQTIDNNSSNGALLIVPDSLKDLNITGLNLDSDADLNTILAKAQIKTGINYMLKNAMDAQLEMKKQIQATTTYPLINTLENSGMGVTYYLLRLTEESNVLMHIYGRNSYEVGLTLGSGNGISIYDLDLNQVTEHNGKLYAGTYIIKVLHDDVVNSVFLINYPALIDQTAHTKLQNGIFNFNGEKFYSLHMQASGQVDFTYDSGLAGNSYPAYIYDTNLSLISHINGTISLDAGDYVVFFDHGAIDKSSNPLTVSFLP
ncbi:hypothetical protein [Sulfurimonas indica]|uniref:hypothetical protein n=1 Tax=Sulfurimonas indica TaxID=2508707 RepID=UPI001264EFF3|nr:hypothetical protein [Sulfurimonas indica]